MINDNENEAENEEQILKIRHLKDKTRTGYGHKQIY